MIILSIFSLFYINEVKFFKIPENQEIFFIIPFDKEGIKIDNLNKKSLNLKNKYNDSLSDFINIEDLKYSIQLYTSDNYSEINQKIDEYNYQLSNNDMYILVFNSSLGIEYFLLYKNFINKESALDYCYNYLKLLDNCVAVNAMNID